MIGWTVVVPVKYWARAKSRIDLEPRLREQLARALTLDTFAAIDACPAVADVVVVSAQPEAAAAARRLGWAVVVDTPSSSPDALNIAVRVGVRWAARHRPHSALVVLPADLAALTEETLRSALGRLSGHERSFVTDATGTGTTLLAARRPQSVDPTYGPLSAAAHRRAGAWALTAVDPRVRTDVDTLDDLAAARRLGVGTHTTAVTALLDARKLSSR